MDLSAGWSEDPLVVLTHRVLRAAVARSSVDAGGLADEFRVPVEDVVTSMRLLHDSGHGKLGPSLALMANSLVPEPRGVAAVSDWSGHSTGVRHRACMSALLSWLTPGGIGGSGGQPLEHFRDDRRSWYFGQPFAETEVVNAAQRLQDKGLVEGRGSSQAPFPRIWLTAPGLECAHDFDGDVRAWEARNAPTTSSVINTFNSYTGDYSQIANASPGATQSVSVSHAAMLDTDRLIQAIRNALAELPESPQRDDVNLLIDQIETEVHEGNNPVAREGLIARLSAKVYGLIGVAAGSGALEAGKRLPELVGELASHVIG